MFPTATEAPGAPPDGDNKEASAGQSMHNQLNAHDSRFFILKIIHELAHIFYICRDTVRPNISMQDKALRHKVVS